MSSADDYYRNDPTLNAYLASMASPGGSYASPPGHAFGQVVGGPYGHGPSAVSYSYEEEEVAAAAPVASAGQKKKRRKAKRDPNKPKGWLLPHILYANANRARMKAHNPDASFGDLARLLSAEYKALSPEDVAAWKQASDEDRERFNLEMQSYVAPSEVSNDDDEYVGVAAEEVVVEAAPKKKRRKKKDPNAPKKNLSAWQIFCGEGRKRILEQNPHASFGEMMSALGERYKALTPEEKAPLDELAAEDKQRYESEMAAYTGEVAD